MNLRRPRSSGLLLLAMISTATAGRADEPVCTTTSLFRAEPKHNHASCIVELPGGDLLAAWYRGTGERKADDVEIWASRWSKASKEWGERFLLADTPGYPDCNPAIFSAPDGSFWLWRPVILDHHWESALLVFSKAKQGPEPGKPVQWEREGVLHVTPTGFDQAMKEALGGLAGVVLRLDESAFSKIEERSRDLLYQRLGWMPRVHPIVLPTGRWLLPLYSDTFSCSLIVRSDDQGATWQPSTPIIGWGAIQPSLVRKQDGTIVAYMRDNGPFRRIRTCHSSDDGVTWSQVTSTELPNPGAGIESIRLASGRWLMVSNDTVTGRHSLALALSDDEGQTWKQSRRLALDPGKTRSFHYPSVIQSADGTIHVSYTHGGQADGSSIDHAALNEAWILAGGEPAVP